MRPEGESSFISHPSARCTDCPFASASLSRADSPGAGLAVTDSPREAMAEPLSEWGRVEAAEASEEVKPASARELVEAGGREEVDEEASALLVSRRERRASMREATVSREAAKRAMEEEEEGRAEEEKEEEGEGEEASASAAAALDASAAARAEGEGAKERGRWDDARGMSVSVEERPEAEAEEEGGASMERERVRAAAAEEEEARGGGAGAGRLLPSSRLMSSRTLSRSRWMLVADE